MKTRKPKKKRNIKARTLLAVAAGLSIGSMVANGCGPDGGGDAPDMTTVYISNDMRLDFAIPADFAKSHD
ncbi:MAG: hypothetical protein JWN44_2952 [Myxococcales bacterium]|nr:hypothetical protein [Myxococcales bacterium]